MKAFHNDPKIKEKYIARVKDHQEADEIAKGFYWEGGKGCAIEGSDHDKYETELGIPSIIAYLEDGIFENLPNELAKEFPLKFLEAIPVGADLSLVFVKMFVWQWEDKEYGLKHIQEISEDKELFYCCEDINKLYKRTINGETIPNDEWQKLEDLADKIESSRAWARAGDRAWSGARAWARARARARAWARAGARSGARARARARAWAGAWAWSGARAWSGANYEKFVVLLSEKLIELLKESK